MKQIQMGRFLIPVLLMGCLSANADGLRADLPVDDFEGGTYGNWKVEGTAFGNAPAKGTLPHQMKVSGYLGNGLVNSFNGGDKTTGTLTSPPFAIQRNNIRFLIGGGGYAGKTCMNLLVDGKTVRTATGSNIQPGGSEELAWQSWNVEDLKGQTARLQIVDRRTGGWGHINVDQIIQTDRKAASVFEKRLTVDGKYLLVPVRNGSSKKGGQVFQWLENGQVVREFRVLLPENGQKADWIAFYPVDEFSKHAVVLKSRRVLPQKYTDAANRIVVSNVIPDSGSDYRLPYRDQFHFSPRRGWNNDVNGLVYNNGTYHLYYQYNPFGIYWDNMHWGHASSTDLVHWTEHDIALFPNSMHDMMFSGGGFMDKGNTSGVSIHGRTPQFAAFTSTGRGECLAYSLDNGMTFTELPENPVVKHNGRDPKIIWYEPEQKWVMTVFDKTKEIMDPPPMNGTPDSRRHDSVAFYSSKNLREWTFESRFIHSDRNAIHECPELFEIAVEGHPGETRWIRYGVENRYFIGEFDGHRFVPESGPFPGEKGIARAAEMVSDAPDGRNIQIAWARDGWYQSRWPDQCFSQGFLIPKEVTLRETPEGLRLFFNPVDEVDLLHGKQLASTRNPSTEEVNRILKEQAGKLMDVMIRYTLGSGAELTLTVNGQPVSSSESGSLRVLSDRTITEAFVNQGEQALSYRRPENPFDDTACGIDMTGDGSIQQLTIYEMNSSW